MKSKNFPLTFIGVILLFQVLPLFLTSCLDDCSGEAIHYRITGLQGEAMEFIASTPSWQSRPWSNELNLISEKLILAFITDTEVMAIGSTNLGFPVAFACDPAINVEAAIRKFELVSNKDYNSKYPAGTDLTEIVLFANSGGFAPFETFMDRERNILKIESSYVRFSEESEQAEPQNFTCTITLTDGKKYSAVIENIILRVK
jgi:hypothetical protein